MGEEIVPEMPLLNDVRQKIPANNLPFHFLKANVGLTHLIKI